MGNSLQRILLPLISSVSLLSFMPQGWGQDQPSSTPLKDDVKDKCGGGKRELTLAPGNYTLSLTVVGGQKSCPVLLQPEGLTSTGTNLPFSPVTVRTNLARDFIVPADGKVHKLVFQCSAPDHDQKTCNYRYSVAAKTGGPPPSPNPTPPVPNPSPAPGPAPPPAPTQKPGSIAGAPDAKLCKDNHESKVIHKAQRIFILTVYHDSQCPVTVTDALDLTVDPGHTQIVARKNVNADQKIQLSCGDSDMKFCRYKDQELPGVTGTIIQEPVNTSCTEAATVLETDAGGIYFLDVAADSTSDCSPVVHVSSGGTVFQDEANPVQPGTASQFGFTIPVGSGPVTIEISCGTESGKKCSYTYKLSNAKTKGGKPPKLKTH